MFEALVITLREGIEAALVVAILLVALDRTGRRGLRPWVHGGLAAAVLASLAGAAALRKLPINEEAYEGVLYWTAALFVASMMLWMHRTSSRLRDHVQAKVERSASRGAWAGLGLAALAFLLVFREGAETVLFLSAVRLSTDGLAVWLGASAGIGLAVVFAVLFIRGGLRFDLGRFFRVTTWILAIFVVQLVVNGYHELSEAGWVPANATTMAWVGPLVRNNTFFTLALVALPLLIWASRPTQRSEAKAEEAPSAARRRLEQARRREERRLRFAWAAVSVAVVGVMGFAYAQELNPPKPEPPVPLAAQDGSVRIPLAALEQGRMKKFVVHVDGTPVRMLAYLSQDGTVRTALDACLICGAKGYAQRGSFLLCLNCVSVIEPSSVGISGGCNPIPLASVREADAVRVSVADLQVSKGMFVAAETTFVDPVCGMSVAGEGTPVLVEAGEEIHFCSRRCLKLYQGRQGRS